ncbi:MAG TPA: RdgB/HAM1 family non-canonical purine NTP pyrophosphatase [Candidatus Eisenbacteria bacterium]|nr:RdgB/HAM1 family non-canonical purine NTP pyrophosphatase [Candidatus Eisenbacteria bacterium]
MIERVVLATRNAGKARELQTLLQGIAARVESLDAYPGVTLPPEGHESFAENARAKARAVSEALAVAAIGDDSGLEVDALGGEPGIRSARYAGEAAGDAANNALLLERLVGVPPERRTARFRCVLALEAPGAPGALVEGVCEGLIAEAPRGTGGFGYDPLFVPNGETRTFAELPGGTKDAISHRARAAAALREALGAGKGF